MTVANIREWRVKNSNLVLDNRWARVRCDACVLPDGTEIGDYYYWEGGDFAQVLALTDSGDVVLTRQYKHGVKEVVLELPAGLVAPGDDGPLMTAQRELSEETGFGGRDWLPLGVLNVSSAKATTRAYPFLLRGATRAEDPHPDEHETIEVVLWPLADLLDLAVSGKIRDSSSLATSLLALRALGRI